MKTIFGHWLFVMLALTTIDCGSKDPSAQNHMGITSTKEWATDIHVKTDYEKLIALTNQVFPADSVLKEFGPGTHNFYLAFTHSQGQQGGEFYYLKYLVLVDGVWTFSRERNMQFSRKFTDANDIFKLGAEDHGKNLVQYYDVKIGIDKKKKIIQPWSITELDAHKYYPRFKKDGNRDDFQTGAFSTIIGGYETLSRKILYPQEAKEKGVTGKVLIVAYVEPSGEVAGTQLIKGIGFGCDEAALQAVSEISFYPTDNRFSATIPVDFELEYKPEDYDLTTTDIAFTPKKVKANEKCTISFNVVNLGDKPSPNIDFETTMYINNELVFASTKGYRTTKGKEGRFWIPWTPNKSGVFEYAIYIDSKKSLNESNRDNNIMRGQITVY